MFLGETFKCYHVSLHQEVYIVGSGLFIKTEKNVGSGLRGTSIPIMGNVHLRVFFLSFHNVERRLNSV